MPEKESLEQSKDSVLQEIQSLKSQLHDMIIKKEQLFQKRGKLIEEFKTLTKQLKDIKRDLDKTTEVKQALKQKRAELNEERKQLLEQFRKKCKEEEEARRKLNIKSLGGIQQTVKRMELQIETQGLPFDQEKRLTEKVKVLRRKMSAAADVRKISDEISSLKQKIDATSKSAYVQNEHLYERIATDRQEFTQLKELAFKVNALRPQLDEATNEFLQSKEAIQQLKNRLDAKNAGAKQLHLQLQEKRKYEFRSKKEREKQMLDAKTKSVEEKIKMRKKLTTQDIIVLQGAMKEEPPPSQEPEAQKQAP